LSISLGHHSVHISKRQTVDSGFRTSLDLML
jgi:hypothetical protein